MAYLNQQQRDTLQVELESMSFGRANGALKRMDERGRLAFYRNAQRSGQWLTKYVLTGLGTQVTLIEANIVKATDRADRVKNGYVLVAVIVEPTADNRN